MIIDLSHPITPSMPVFPGDSQTRFTELHNRESSGFSVHEFAMNTHAGTHIDSPSHYLVDGTTVDENSILEKSSGPAHCIDVSRSMKKNVISVASLDNELDLLKSGSRILLHTGWSERYGEDDYYSAFPSLTFEAAEIFAENEIHLIGLDTPSLSLDNDTRVHRVLLESGIVIVENLRNLGCLSGRDFFFSAAPLKLTGLDGSPVRAYAIVDDKN